MINLDHLRYFSDATRLGSISAAARLHRVSQSAVSQAIRSLEQSLGCELTTHQKRSLHLTDEGRALLVRSEQVFRSVRELAESLEELKAGFAGPLSIACTNTIGSLLLPEILGKLCQKHPALRPRVLVGNSETIQEWILRREVDLGLMVDDHRLTREFRKEVIRTGRYLLVASSLRGSKKNLVQGLVVTRKDRSEVRALMKKLQSAGSSLEVHCEITSWEAIKAYLLQHGGHGICPDYVIHEELAKGRLREVKLPGKSPEYQLIAAYRANEPLGKNVRLLLESLMDS